MDREQFFQSILSSLGGAENISRQVWRGSKLCVTVKDVGVLRLNALEDMDTIVSVELNCGRVTMSTQGLEKEEEIEMAKKNYDELAGKIVELVGGKDNFTKFFHCVTRLRFIVKDKSKVKEDEIKKIGGVVGTKWADNQIQIIIGTDVADAYNAICQQNNISIAPTEDSATEEAPAKKKFSFAAVIEAVTGCIIPLIPAFMGCALVRTFGIVLGMTGIISTESTTYQLLDMVGTGCNYFMPILVAQMAAKKFGATDSLAMALCALLLAPGFMSNVANGVPMTLFGLPVYAGDYSNMLFPSIIIVFVMSYVEKLFKKHVKILPFMTLPFLTALVMVPLEFCLLAPIGLWIGEIITSAIMFIYTHVGFVAVGLLAGLFPLLVLTGMHTATVPAMMTCYMTYGFDPIILPSMTLYNFNQGISALAVMLKTRNPDTRAAALGAAVPALVAGVTEPALFGINLRYKTPLIAAMIGGFVGGCYLGIQSVGCYAAGGLGVMSILGFISSEPRTLLHGVIGVIISTVVTFVAAFVLYKDKKEEV